MVRTPGIAVTIIGNAIGSVTVLPASMTGTTHLAAAEHIKQVFIFPGENPDRVCLIFPGDFVALIKSKQCI